MEDESSLKAAAGTYPVDILEDDPEGHQEATLAYHASLGEGAQTSSEIFSLSSGEQVKLETSSTCFCSLHRDEPHHKILVLVNPQDTKTVVAVYLKESWWSTEDVLRTSDPTREGLVKVQSFGERIVLFVLNVIIFGRLERSLDDDDMFFLPHSVKERAKILWRNGAAVGFYTTKVKGSLCGNGTGACYLLPVFDTVFVRRKHRRQGLGTAMLQDFCDTFPEDDALGLSCPISPAMYGVCRQFLLAHPEERGRLWEVEALGVRGQRVNIWLKVQQQARLPEGPRVRILIHSGRFSANQLHLVTIMSASADIPGFFRVGRAVHPGDSKEDLSNLGQTSLGDRPTEFADGDGHTCDLNLQDSSLDDLAVGFSLAEQICGEELENMKNDQDCAENEKEVGLPTRPSWAELEGKEVKRTVAVPGLLQSLLDGLCLAMQGHRAQPPSAPGWNTIFPPLCKKLFSDGLTDPHPGRQAPAQVDEVERQRSRFSGAYKCRESPCNVSFGTLNNTQT
ncbi:protein FAM169B [Marmota monax]|uniref:protein FAM169B n=1 Tax=Marmota monax TaxID=9995 RepID=UPI0026ED7C7C|nr:protein FAM169B [Marmota monax]